MPIEWTKTSDGNATQMYNCGVSGQGSDLRLDGNFTLNSTGYFTFAIVNTWKTSWNQPPKAARCIHGVNVGEKALQVDEASIIAMACNSGSKTFCARSGNVYGWVGPARGHAARYILIAAVTNDHGASFAYSKPVVISIPAATTTNYRDLGDPSSQRTASWDTTDVSKQDLYRNRFKITGCPKVEPGGELYLCFIVDADFASQDEWSHCYISFIMNASMMDVQETVQPDPPLVPPDDYEAPTLTGPYIWTYGVFPKWDYYKRDIQKLEENCWTETIQVPIKDKDGNITGYEDQTIDHDDCEIKTEDVKIPYKAPAKTCEFGGHSIPAYDFPAFSGPDTDYDYKMLAGTETRWGLRVTSTTPPFPSGPIEKGEQMDRTMPVWIFSNGFWRDIEEL